MSLIPDKCIEFKEQRKICIAYENGKKYELINFSNLNIRKVKVDNCLDQKEGQRRCDYLMDVEERKRVIFIELKGGDLNSSIEQIHSTTIFLHDEYIGFRKDARIIGGRDVPGFKNTPNYKRLAKVILTTKGTIERATNKFYTEKI